MRVIECLELGFFEDDFIVSICGELLDIDCVYISCIYSKYWVVVDGVNMVVLCCRIGRGYLYLIVDSLWSIFGFFIYFIILVCVE